MRSTRTDGLVRIDTSSTSVSKVLTLCNYNPGEAFWDGLAEYGPLHIMSFFWDPMYLTHDANVVKVCALAIAYDCVQRFLWRLTVDPCDRFPHLRQGYVRVCDWPGPCLMRLVSLRRGIPRDRALRAGCRSVQRGWRDVEVSNNPSCPLAPGS